MPETPLVGRDELLRSVEDHLRARRPVVLTGHAGIGKSRLAWEATRSIRADGVRIVEAQGNQASREVPLGAFAFLLRPGGRSEADLASALWDMQLALLEGDGRKVLLFVDDAHLLDPLSIMLVLRVARTSEARLLLTIRQGEDVPPALVDIWSEGSAERVPVEPLGRPALEQMVTNLVGARLAPDAADEFWRLSSGNPLCARELAFDAVASDRLVIEKGVARRVGELSVSDRIGELIGARLAALPAGTAEGLRLLAVAGTLPLTNFRHAASAEVLDDLERRGLVRMMQRERRALVATSHPLYGELMAKSMGEGANSAVASRLYETAMALPNRRAGDLVERAVWGLDSGRSLAPSVLNVAAAEALSTHSPETAERFSRAAIGSERSSRSVLMLAESLVYQGRLGEADDAFVEASVLAVDAEESALVALARARADAFSGRDIPGALERLKEASQSSLPPDVADGLAAHRGLILMMAVHQDEAIAAVEPVIAREPPPSDDTLLLALGVAVSSCGWAGRVRDARRFVELASGPASRSRTMTLVDATTAVVMESYALFAGGKYAEAVRVLEASAERFPGIESITGVGLGICHVSAGHPMPGLRLLEPGCAVVEGLGDPLRQLGWGGAMILEAGLMVGKEFDELEPLCAQISGLSPEERALFDAEIQRVIGLWTLHAGDRQSALEHFRVAVASATARGMLTFAVKALDDMARFGWAAEAADTATAISENGDPEWLTAHGVARHARALAAGDADALAALADDYASWGWVLRAAEIAAAASACYLDRGQTASAFRMEVRSRSWEERVEGADTMLLRARRPILGARARELAEMVAAGMSNPEIAGALVLSRRTVENHLYRAYRDLGISNREDLAELVHSGRSIDDELSDARLASE